MAPVVLIDGVMNSKSYIKTVEKNVSPIIAKGWSDKNGIFKQDLAPRHKSMIGVETLQRHQIPVSIRIGQETYLD